MILRNKSQCEYLLYTDHSDKVLLVIPIEKKKQKKTNPGPGVKTNQIENYYCKKRLAHYHDTNFIQTAQLYLLLKWLYQLINKKNYFTKITKKHFVYADLCKNCFESKNLSL